MQADISFSSIGEDGARQLAQALLFWLLSYLPMGSKADKSNLDTSMSATYKDVIRALGFVRCLRIAFPTAPGAR